MKRKRITQIFPWLIPLRTWQRKIFFYLGMKLDRNRYTSCVQENLLPAEVFSSRCPLYNKETGFDMVYQENKVHNLKLAAAAIDRMLIRPGKPSPSVWPPVMRTGGSPTGTALRSSTDG